MSEIAPTISPLALSVLELLDERAMHPYELASTMRERHHDEFIRLNFGTLYHTVEMLERTGMIASVEREKEGRRPERTIYQLTEPGRELLVSVVSDILARPTREYVNFASLSQAASFWSVLSATSLPDPHASTSTSPPGSCSCTISMRRRQLSS